MLEQVKDDRKKYQDIVADKAHFLGSKGANKEAYRCI